MATMNVMKFNTTEILFPTSMSRTSNDIEQEFITESGKSQFISTRRDKQSIAMSFTCSSAWMKKFKEFYILDSFTLTEYDSITNANETRTVRMKNYVEDFVPKSNTVDSSVSQGLWNVSFTLEEL
ncbi:MAG: hypothetical protein IJH64_00265 [Oscillospiraceae bacterium]|nr:hypothetical protein [Oscillospiraceae bacterium]